MIHWCKFSKWADVLVFGFGSSKFVLQGRKCPTCGATKFDVVGARDGVVTCETLTEEHLKKAGLWVQGECAPQRAEEGGPA